MEQVMTKEESYVQRRQLFKNIWETAMHIDDKEVDILNKPKVIKTLRMDEINRCPAGTTKKQRIKNLRQVCNRILDFCDRQDAVDHNNFDETKDQNPNQKVEHKHCKFKTIHLRKKVKRAKSLFTASQNPIVARATSEGQEHFVKAMQSEVRKTTPKKRKRITFKAKTAVKTIKPNPSPETKILTPSAAVSIVETVAARRKTVKKKRKTKKTTSNI